MTQMTRSHSADDRLRGALALLDELEPGTGVRLSGRGRQHAGEQTVAVVDPSSEEEICRLPSGGPRDAEVAVESAQDALPRWSATAPRERADVLTRAFGLMMADIDRLAALISWENGKSSADACAEVRYAAEFFRWFGEEAVRTEDRYGQAPGGGSRAQVIHRPVGVAALVTPWNFPAAMVTRKVAPALAAGCTTVLKPAAETPLTALAIADVLRRAGAPAGVLNVVPTTDAAGVVSTWIAADPVRKLSFTGSTEVGRVLLRQAADRVVNVSMELGGNAPFVVTADADVAQAVRGAMVAKYRNGGQACTAANRFYVHERVAEEFGEALVAASRGLRVGPGLEPGTQVGPLVSASARDRVGGIVEDALDAGAKLACRGAAPAHGFFHPPTVLIGVDPASPLLRTEIFGPVAPVVTWSDEAEMLAQVNDVELGLAGYVYSGDLRHALSLAEALEVGMVGVNQGVVSDPSAPFGGVKQSGLGREGSREGIREYQEPQYLAVAWPGAS